MSYHPIIGITGARHEFVSRDCAPNLFGVVSSDDYAEAVAASGAAPVVIPYVHATESIARLADKLDGVVLGGGEDPDPTLYGQPPRRGLATVIRERDDMELQLIHRMLEQGKPILGICRGIQILNVAFGGSLWQDLAREWSGTIQHHQRAARTHTSHKVTVAADSHLCKILGQEELFCNSFHHQAVRQLGEGLQAVAWDEEGLIEAVEHPGHPFVVGIQWHPENLWRVSEPAMAVFRALIEAAVAANEDV